MADFEAGDRMGWDDLPLGVILLDGLILLGPPESAGL